MLLAILLRLTLTVRFEDDLRVVGPNTVFSITDGTTEKFVVDTDNGNTHTDGTLDVDGGVTFNSTLDVDLATTLNSTLDVDCCIHFPRQYVAGYHW